MVSVKENFYVYIVRVENKSKYSMYIKNLQLFNFVSKREEENTHNKLKQKDQNGFKCIFLVFLCLTVLLIPGVEIQIITLYFICELCYYIPIHIYS